MAETLPQMTEMLASATTAVETHNKQSKGDIVQ
jgi:hypothetical protein